VSAVVVRINTPTDSNVVVQMPQRNVMTDEIGPPSYEHQRRYSPNVIIFGETGAGKSSVVNLIAGEDLANVSSSAVGCTLDSTSYDLVLSDAQDRSHHIRVFDTVGLNEATFSPDDYLKAIEKANELICELQRTGGIRLLIFCIRGGRITSATQNNYRLFYEILCQNEVPIAFVITGLENERSMEDWWTKNALEFEKYQLHCASHACVTATRGLHNLHAQKYQQSQNTVRAMLLQQTSNGERNSWKPAEQTGWLIHTAARLLKWVFQNKARRGRRRRRALTIKELIRFLENSFSLSPSDAEDLASKIWEMRQDSAGPDFVKREVD
jgi:tRNA U34 5-carboxymethylaminomethyl modifying GTPase MnmE/TrmE